MKKLSMLLMSMLMLIGISSCSSGPQSYRLISEATGIEIPADKDLALCVVNSDNPEAVEFAEDWLRASKQFEDQATFIVLYTGKDDAALKALEMKVEQIGFAGRVYMYQDINVSSVLDRGPITPTEEIAFHLRDIHQP